MQRAITRNTLFYGDNLAILREYIPDESVDLIYLDPPFNSNRSYNVLFKEESGSEAEAQITAFDDAWHWGETAEKTYREMVTQSPQRVEQLIGALREFIGANQMMAYLVMMAARLVELHRVLKPAGSLYLHCDRRRVIISRSSWTLSLELNISAMSHLATHQRSQRQQNVE